MMRKQNILIGFLSAAVTFGSLYAFAGERYFARHSYEKRCNWRENQHAHSDHWYKESERPALKDDARQ